MGTRGLPDIYTLSPRACGPQASGVYIRQTTLAHVTTIRCICIYKILSLQDCFKGSWKVHKVVHKQQQGKVETTYNPWPHFQFTGPLRPFPKV